MNQKLKPVAALAMTFCLLHTSSVYGAEEYFPPAENQAGWRINTDLEFIESLGIDSAALDEWVQWNMQLPTNPRAMSAIVVKDGWIVSENYHDPATRLRPAPLSSISKTIALVLFGIVFDDARSGYINRNLSPQSQIYDRDWLWQGYPLSDPRKKDITIQQVLQHTSGLCPTVEKCSKELVDGKYHRSDTPWDDYATWVLGHDVSRAKPAQLYFTPGNVGEYHDPKELKGYSNVGFSHLGILLRNLYGIPASDVLETRMLIRIGILETAYPHSPGKDIGWDVAGGLAIAPRDLARFAWLIANGGKWGPEQVVPARWLSRISDGDTYRNFQTNLNGEIGEMYPADLIRFSGRGGNMVIIVPSLALLAIRTDQFLHKDESALQDEFISRLLAAVRSEDGS